MQFWNAEKTEQSMSVLKFLPKRLGFVLIGGWAVYSYVKAQKSEDVDIAIDPERLDFFRRYGIREHEGSSIKYSIVDGATVDLFVNGYSDRDLPVPISRIMKEYTSIDGIRVVSRELLLILKLWGYFSNDETKIRKDIIDVTSLVFYANIDFEKFKRLIDEYKIPKRRSTDALLEYVAKSESVWGYIADSKGEFDRLKEKYSTKLRKLFAY